MADNVEAMIAEGKRLFKAKRKDEARVLFNRATEHDPHNAEAWLWLSAVMETYEDQRVCLENVLFIDPTNKQAKQGLRMLAGKSGPVMPAAPPASSAPAAGISAPEAAPPPRREVPPTATSSASSIFLPEDEPTSEEYDSWLKGLKLGNKSSSQGSTDLGALRGGGGVFDDDAFSNADPFGVDKDDTMFGSLPDEFDDPFSANTVREDSDEIIGGPFTADLDIEDLRMMVEEGFPPPVAASPPTRQASPVGGPPVSRKNQTKAPAQLDMDIDDLGYDDDADPGIYFLEIPDGIKATRLPGTDERQPILLMIVLVLLVLANAGAAALLVMKLLG